MDRGEKGSYIVNWSKGWGCHNEEPGHGLKHREQTTRVKMARWSGTVVRFSCTYEATDALTAFESMNQSKIQSKSGDW